MPKTARQIFADNDVSRVIRQLDPPRRYPRRSYDHAIWLGLFILAALGVGLALVWK